MQIAQASGVNLRYYAKEAGVPNASNPEGFSTVLGGVLSAVMAISALLVLLYIIWGAVDWITAGGDSGKIGKAREKIVQGVIGLIILASALAIFSAVQTFIGVSFLDFNGGSGAAGGGAAVLAPVNNGVAGQAQNFVFQNGKVNINGSDVTNKVKDRLATIYNSTHQDRANLEGLTITSARLAGNSIIIRYSVQTGGVLNTQSATVDVNDIGL